MTPAIKKSYIFGDGVLDLVYHFDRRYNRHTKDVIIQSHGMKKAIYYFRKIDAFFFILLNGTEN